MRNWALAAGLFIATGAIAPAGAAPTRDLLVQPGRGIGKLRLGMTQAEVRRVLGAHTYVAKRRRLGFGEQYLELQWGYAEWTVGFQGRRGELRAVMVGTGLRRQRTREGLGTGSRIRDILRVYPRATCSNWPGTGSGSSLELWVVVGHPNRTATVFALTHDGHVQPPRYYVVEVMVRRPARGLAEQRTSCAANWRNR